VAGTVLGAVVGAVVGAVDGVQAAKSMISASAAIEKKRVFMVFSSRENRERKERDLFELVVKADGSFYE
jgi:uncharacterized protein YcfJ